MLSKLPLLAVIHFLLGMLSLIIALEEMQTFFVGSKVQWGNEVVVGVVLVGLGVSLALERR